MRHARVIMSCVCLALALFRYGHHDVWHIYNDQQERALAMCPRAYTRFIKRVQGRSQDFFSIEAKETSALSPMPTEPRARSGVHGEWATIPNPISYRGLGSAV